MFVLNIFLVFILFIFNGLLKAIFVCVKRLWIVFHLYSGLTSVRSGFYEFFVNYSAEIIKPGPEIVEFL